jgi:hypothetical protein
MIETLRTKYPNAFILFCTPFNRNGIEEPYVEAMKEVCSINAIPCFDDYHNSGLNFANLAVNSLYELSSSKHFNEAGYTRLSFLYESLLKTYITINMANTKQVECINSLSDYTNLNKNKNVFYIVKNDGIYFNGEKILSQGQDNRVLSSIAITTPPTKTAYFSGEIFDPTGMVVTATYDNGDTEPVSDYSFSPNIALTALDTEVTISYTHNNVTKTATQQISVTSASFVSAASIENHFYRDSQHLNRCLWIGALPSGVSINLKDNLQDSYKFAIAYGTNGWGSHWIGGGYHTGDFVTDQATDYSVQFAPIDSEGTIDNEIAQMLIENFGYYSN